MTQLTPNHEYSEIHCQVFEDLTTLKVDQGSDCIIEFPLDKVSNMYCTVKSDVDRKHVVIHSDGSKTVWSVALSNAKHVVYVEFMRRKLAFAFNESATAQKFLMCMGLLVRRAQEITNVDKCGTGKPKDEQLSFLRTLLTRMVPDAVEVQVGVETYHKFLDFWDAAQKKGYTQKPKPQKKKA